MSVRAVLDKIRNHNADVRGCIAASGGVVHHNLPDDLTGIDAAALGEHAANLFAVSGALDDGGQDYATASLEYAGHSVLARRLDDGVLVVICQPMRRAGFRKLEIGVTLFIGPLRAALGPEPLQQPLATPSPGPPAARDAAKSPHERAISPLDLTEALRSPRPPEPLRAGPEPEYRLGDPARKSRAGPDRSARRPGRIFRGVEY